MLWNPLYLQLTLLHQALVTESRRTWRPSPTSLGICGLCLRRPQRHFKCSKQCCQLRDVVRVTASCCNDVMISYKSSRLVGNVTTFQLFIGYRLPTVPSLSLSNRALFQNHSGGSHCFHELKLCFSCLSNSVGSTVYSAPCRLVRTVPTAFSV